MAATLTFWALLTRTAVGIFAMQILLDRRILGKLFFRVNTWLAIGLLAVGLSFRVPGAFPQADSEGASRGQALLGLSLYFGCLVLFLAYLLALRRSRAGWANWIQRASLPVGLAALVLDSLGLAPGAPLPGAILIPASAVTASFLLGSVLLAMMLGHWYLVIANLSIRLLARATVAHIVAVIARAAALGATLAFHPLGPGLSPTSPAGIFLISRVLFGILGPLMISVLIWKTVKIRSTQSATGLLYVAVAFVLAGELVAAYLLFVDGIPV